MKFRALDLFCGAGGASTGLHRAGFDVTGVDINNQPRYPFKFRIADAMNYPLEGFDFIWASPPCQAYSSMKSLHRDIDHPDLVGPIRSRLEQSGATWCIENVRNAPLLHAFMLCGLSFGLKTYRHRFFETTFMALGPSHIPHDQQAIRERRIFSCIGHPGGRSARDNLHFGNTEDWKMAMGIDWMIGKELAESIPPAYSEFFGLHAIEFLRRAA
jgi:DNA (cytosine-5)-methyltransferase 1